MPLPPGKDEWQMLYPSGTENWQIPHPISGRGPSGIHLILLLPDVEGPVGFLSLFLSSS